MSTLTLDTAVETFESVTGTPWDAHDQCYRESQRFIAHLASHGIEGTLVTGYRFSGPETRRVVEAGHCAVNVGGTVYDWTARQFHTGIIAEYVNVPWPLVQPANEWRKTWVNLTL